MKDEVKTKLAPGRRSYLIDELARLVQPFGLEVYLTAGQSVPFSLDLIIKLTRISDFAYARLMNRQTIGIWMLFVVAVLAKTAFGVDQSEDEAAIRRVVARQQESWNSHDAKAYVDTFTEDADVVNVLGWWWKGRPEIEKKLTDAFAFVFRESTLTFSEVNVKFLSPELAVVHARWTMVGAKTPGKGASAPQQGIQTQLLQKPAGKWLMAAVQNTNAMPEMPFPKGPPPPNAAASVSP